jgi:endonuclease-3
MQKELKQLGELQKRGGIIQLAAEDWKKPWETLIATLMSARTRDEVTIPTASKLFKKYNTVEKLSKASLSDIQKIIKPINFYRNKSKSVLNCAKAIVKEHHGKVPVDFEKLIKLPGVGRKTANVFLSEMGEDSIGVDTHVFYISRKIGWTKNTKPEKIEQDLKNLFPKKYWGKVNSVLVRFGKTHTSRKQKDQLIEKISKVR